MIPAVKASPKTIRAVALHKPPGYLSTRVKPSAPKRPSAYDCLPYGWDTPEAPLGACGRLDKESSGLLLFTDDGLLSQALLHPRFEHQAITETPSHIAKTYHLQLSDAVSNTQLHELAQPITLGEGRKRGPVTTLPAEVSRVKSSDSSALSPQRIEALGSQASVTGPYRDGCLGRGPSAQPQPARD